MKKIICNLLIGFLMLLCIGGCRHQALIDDTPKSLTESDFVKIDEFASLNAMQQNSIMELTTDDLNYAIKYFQHFSEVASLANINAILIKIDNIDNLDIHSAKNQKFMEFINLLSYYKINVIYEFDLDKLLFDFNYDMDEEEELEYTENLKDDLHILLEFLDSFDDKSKIATLSFKLKLPTIANLQQKSKSNSLLSRAGNNEYGFEKDNNIAYNQALAKLKFARKFFGLEQLIWRIDLPQITLGLADKIMNRKNLDFEILTAVDMVIFQMNFSDLAKRCEAIAAIGNISKSIIIGVTLTPNQKWANFITPLQKSVKNSIEKTAFSGILLNSYGEFYRSWRYEILNSETTTEGGGK